MICIYCDKEVQKDELNFFLAFEVPYINLRVHRSCWRIYKDTNFIHENAEKILKYISELPQKKK